MDYRNPHTGLTREQKTGFVLLLIFGLLAVGLGILQMRNTIFGPFVVRLSQTTDAEENLFLDENARLQSIDTDRDGLNDYDELNVYETSPYLPDTDSDGIDDKMEIENETNPLCAEGETCAEDAGIVYATSTPIVSPLVENPASSQSASEVDELQEFLTDPAKIREVLLKNSSMTKAQLDKIDDASLMTLLNDVLKEQGGAATTTKQ